MEKPVIEVDLRGADGSVFALMTKARTALMTATPLYGTVEQRRRRWAEAAGKADKMMRAAMQTHSYDEALSVIRQYVTIQEKGGEPMK